MVAVIFLILGILVLTAVCLWIAVPDGAFDDDEPRGK
jgi:hypothetical protein